ncbi:MAG: acyl-CoA dehydrogenase family protein [Actinomycetia bacterium]|nr:acyl-CoA dehydrogenase family protein [Actinomycetes bacterium]
MNPTDMLGIDGLIEPDERDMQRSVRAVLDESVRPHLAEWFEAGSVPVRQLAPRFGELGLLGMHLEGYGCAGTSATAYGLAAARSGAVGEGVVRRPASPDQYAVRTVDRNLQLETGTFPVRSRRSLLGEEKWRIRGRRCGGGADGAG